MRERQKKAGGGRLLVGEGEEEERGSGRGEVEEGQK